MVNAKRKQDDRPVLYQTQDTTTEDPNNIIMEDQTLPYTTQPKNPYKILISQQKGNKKERSTSSAEGPV